jgi:hypothetical protein
MSSRKSSSKPNGHAGTQGRPNGHVPASTDGSGIPKRRDLAAADDDSRASVTGAAGSGTAPGTDCEAYAVAAPLRPIGKKKENGDRSATELRDSILARGTDFAVMQDGSAYVDAVAARVDLVA